MWNAEIIKTKQNQKTPQTQIKVSINIGLFTWIFLIILHDILLYANVAESRISFSLSPTLLLLLVE